MSIQSNRRAREHAERSNEQINENQIGAGILSDLALIQDIPGTELQLSCDTLHRIRVTRNGVSYGIQTRNGPSTNGKHGRSVYAVGADLGDGIEYPYLKGNCYGSLHDALHALREVILWDPRQYDIPDHHRATHFSVTVPVPTDD